MKNYTIIELENGVLSFHTEGAMEHTSWRRFVSVGISWLMARGGGKLVLPHPPMLTD